MFQGVPKITTHWIVTRKRRRKRKTSKLYKFQQILIIFFEWKISETIRKPLFYSYEKKPDWFAPGNFLEVSFLFELVKLIQIQEKHFWKAITFESKLAVTNF